MPLIPISLQKGGLSSSAALAIKMAAQDAEIPYTTVASADSFPETPFMPVGRVDFCLAAMRHQGIDTSRGFTSYPTVLISKLFIPRRTELTAYQHVLASFMPRGDVSYPRWFVKPHWPPKAFEAKLLTTPQDVDLPLDMNARLWVADEVRFVSEWRYYVVDHHLVGQARYDDGADDAPAPSLSLVQEAILRMSRSRDTPVGYVLDFGVLADGSTSLVEANDGWAVGLYRGEIHRREYLRMLQARWQQIHTEKRLTLS